MKEEEPSSPALDPSSQINVKINHPKLAHKLFSFPSHNQLK